MKTTAVHIIKDDRTKDYVAQCRTCNDPMELNADGTGYHHPVGPRGK